MKPANSRSTVGKRAADILRYTPPVLAATDTQFTTRGTPMEIVCTVLDEYVGVMKMIEDILDGNHQIASEFSSTMTRNYRDSMSNLKTPYLEAPAERAQKRYNQIDR
jgi:hypothetical protein